MKNTLRLTILLLMLSLLFPLAPLAAEDAQSGQPAAQAPQAEPQSDQAEGVQADAAQPEDSGPERTASLEISGQLIPYAPPAGYLLADEAVYAAPLELLAGSVPKEAVIHALYVPEATDRRFREDPSAPLDAFLLIMSNSKGGQSMLIVSDFKQLSAEVSKKFGNLPPDWQPSFTEGIPEEAENAPAEEAANTPAPEGDLPQLLASQNGGCYGGTDTSISLLAMVTQKLPGPEGEIRHMAVVSTSLLSESKILTVNQQKLVSGQDELTAFKEEALALVESMNFKQGAAQGVTVSGLKKSFSLMNKIILGVLAGLIVAYILRRTKRRGLFDKY